MIASCCRILAYGLYLSARSRKTWFLSRGDGTRVLYTPWHRKPTGSSLLLLGVYMVRSSDRLVGPTQATFDRSVRPVGPTGRTDCSRTPPTSVNQINVAC